PAGRRDGPAQQPDVQPGRPGRLLGIAGARAIPGASHLGPWRLHQGSSRRPGWRRGRQPQWRDHHRGARQLSDRPGPGAHGRSPNADPDQATRGADLYVHQGDKTVKRALGIALAALLGVARVAAGEEVSTRPFLRIETGMHTAAIWRIDTDAAGRFLVTGSEDKTARVWDLANGQLLRTLRAPIGEGNEGKIYSVAMSPDGELVAAAGWTGYNWERHNSIYLFERRSGRLIRRLRGFPEVIKNLAFSPDGSRLAATMGGPFGLRVFRIPDGQEMGRDESYGGDGVGAAFAADGRLVTASFDGKIRLYDRDLQLLAAVSMEGGKRPYSVAFSPDGRRI